MKARISFQSSETDAIRLLADKGPVIDFIIGFVEIAGKILTALVRQRSR